MEPKYGRVTRKTIEQLKSIVGGDSIFTNESEIEGYSHDEAPRAEHYAPQVVVKPKDTGSVARLLAFASEEGVPVTPQGRWNGIEWWLYAYLWRYGTIAGENEPGS